MKKLENDLRLEEEFVLKNFLKNSDEFQNGFDKLKIKI